MPPREALPEAVAARYDAPSGADQREKSAVRASIRRYRTSSWRAGAWPRGH